MQAVDPHREVGGAVAVRIAGDVRDSALLVVAQLARMVAEGGFVVPEARETDGPEAREEATPKARADESLATDGRQTPNTTER